MTGVGFSYSDQADPREEGGDYVTNDATAAKDNYALVQAFLDRFPQYRKNDVSPDMAWSGITMTWCAMICCVALW